MARNTNMEAMTRHFKQVLQYAPGLLANDAVNFFQDSFKRQGWLGNRLEPWRKRKNNRNRPGRAILVDTARLKRSIRHTKVSAGTAVVGTDVPYAKAHNEGFRGTVRVAQYTRGKYTKMRVGSGKFTKKGKERMKTVTSLTGQTTVKAHSRKMNLPRRQFMGSSPYLTAQLKRRLQAELMKGLR
jgi:phage gpG-like protein